MRSYTTTQIIAKEGWNHCLVVLMITLIAYAIGFLPWLFSLLFIATLFVYRNPERLVCDEDENALVSPVDGTISAISKVHASDGQEWLRVVIQKNISDVGIIRAPIAMHVIESKKRFGLPLSSTSSLAKSLREKVVLTCKGKEVLIKMVFYTGQWSQKIDIFDKAGYLKAGERLAFLQEGEVALLLPLDTRIKVVLNDNVKAAQSVLGYLSYKANDESK